MKSTSISTILGSPVALIIAISVLLFVIVSALLYSDGTSYSGGTTRDKMSIAERERIEQQAQEEEDRLEPVIAAGKVLIGMSASQCERAWGKSEHVNTTITRFRRSEQWVYGDGRYLYLKWRRACFDSEMKIGAADLAAVAADAPKERSRAKQMKCSAPRRSEPFSVLFAAAIGTCFRQPCCQRRCQNAPIIVVNCSKSGDWRRGESNPCPHRFPRRHLHV